MEKIITAHVGRKHKSNSFSLTSILIKKLRTNWSPLFAHGNIKYPFHWRPGSALPLINFIQSDANSSFSAVNCHASLGKWLLVLFHYRRWVQLMNMLFDFDYRKPKEIDNYSRIDQRRWQSDECISPLIANGYIQYLRLMCVILFAYNDG